MDDTPQRVPWPTFFLLHLCVNFGALTTKGSILWAGVGFKRIRF
jgi:hypothetical protein